MTDSPLDAREHPRVPDDSQPASLFYSVEVHTEQISRRRARWRAASAVVVDMLIPDWLGPSGIPKLRTTVAVVRTSDGSVVESYDYHSPLEVGPHTQLLRDRVDSMTKADFEATLDVRA